EDGDRVMVCLSGGKDSHVLLDLLLDVQKRAPVRFDLLAVNLDQKQPNFPAEVLPEYLEERGVPFRIVERDTYSVVKRLVPEGKTYCSVCSRLRRGILYSTAVELGCSKIALGHHRDDLIESLLLSMFFSGKTRTMPPRLRANDGRNVVIRPLCYSAEADIAPFDATLSIGRFPFDWDLWDYARSGAGWNKARLASGSSSGRVRLPQQTRAELQGHRLVWSVTLLNLDSETHSTDLIAGLLK